jgi:hypothetical protein
MTHPAPPATSTLMQAPTSRIQWTGECSTVTTNNKQQTNKKNNIITPRAPSPRSFVHILIARNSQCRFNSAKGNAHPNTRWEAFSFELIPLNAYYTMLQADFRNGLRRDGAPPLPAYSWDDDKSVSFDMSTAWGRDNVRRWREWEEGFTSQPSSSGSFERLLHLRHRRVRSDTPNTHTVFW